MASTFFTRAGAKPPAAPAAASMQDNRCRPWVEKYRPATISDIAAQSQVVRVLRATIESKNLPHLLFYGPPGTGKTSTILALARDIFGEHYRSRVMELNASDERGIVVVREKIKAFARTVVTTGAGAAAASQQQHQQQQHLPSYKIIILDEADSMTGDAQAALRRTMERYSATTRFCLICNYVSRIIDPLASRCAKFRFAALDADSARSRLEYIAKAENLVVESDTLDALVRASSGDLRRAIMYLQTAAMISPKIMKSGEECADIAASTIDDVAGTIPQSLVTTKLRSLWRCGSLIKNPGRPGAGADSPQAQTSATNVAALVDELMREGYPASQLLIQLHSALVDDEQLPSLAKAHIAAAFAAAEFKLAEGADEYLQLVNLLLECVRLSNRS